MNAVSWTWIDGTLSPGPEARVAAADRGLHYGDGVFETLRAERGRAFLLDAHLERMRAGLGVLGIAVGGVVGRAREGTAAVAARLAEEDAATIKIMVTRGVGPGGPSCGSALVPTVIAIGRADAPERPDSMRAVTSSVVRNERSPLARVKSLNYLEMVLARREAEAAGVEEALMMNTQGRLAEAAAANVFAVVDGRLVTPPVSEGCLPGIVRTEVMRIAEASGIRVRQTPMPPEMLGEASEAFLTNSRIGIVPLVEIDGRLLGAGPVAARLRGAFHEVELASAGGDAA